MTRTVTILGLTVGALLLPLAAEESEEPFDPRRPPETKVVKAEIKQATKAWKKATDKKRKEILDSLDKETVLRDARREIRARLGMSTASG